MSIYKKILVFVLVISLLSNATKVIAEPIEISPNSSYEVLVENFTILYGGDVLLNKAIIECESQWNETALGDSGRSYGLFQFQKASFERMSKAFGEELNYYSSYDQLKLGVWAVNNGYANEWTSYRAIMNGGKYSFYSKQLKQHFTVYCSL